MPFKTCAPSASEFKDCEVYGLKRWAALSHYLGDGTIPIDNNHIENQIRPWALGRKNWLFTVSLRSGQRAAALMSLIQLAKLKRT